MVSCFTQEDGMVSCFPKGGMESRFTQGLDGAKKTTMTGSHVWQRRLLVYTIRAQIVTGLGFIVGLVLMS